MSERPNRPAPPSPLSPDQLREHLAYELENALKRRDELVRALADMLDKLDGEIADDETLGNVGENHRMALGWLRMFEGHRTTQKKPLRQAASALDDWFEEKSRPLLRFVAQAQGLMDVYVQKKADAARKVAEQQAAEAKQKAREAAEQAAREIARTGTIGDDTQAIAVKASKAATAATALAEGRPADLARVTGVYGAVVSARRTWAPVITNLKQLPADLLLANLPEIRRRAMAGPRAPDGRPLTEIPGVDWVATDKAAVR